MMFAVPTYYPLDVQVRGAGEEEQYTLVVTWASPPLERLDGRLVSQFEVQVHHVSDGGNRLVVSATMPANVTR